VNVPSYEFLAFAGIVAVLINLSAKTGWRRAILLVANLGFVATFTHDPKQLAPFASLLVLGFGCMKLMERYKSRAIFVAFVIAVLFVFCWLKRYAFVPSDLFLPFPYFAVGMSYVFFRIMHLIIDAYQDALPESVGALSYVNYTLNFTCLVSGPIQLYPDYHRSESEDPPALNRQAIEEGLARIVTGFFKVSVISAALAYAQGLCIGALSTHLSLESRVLFGGLVLSLFPVYLYFNFSGYTDFVIGSARFLRLELPENFNKPFTARSVLEFWGRWHMTLSNWLKTYVYSPLLLSLMRRFPSPRVQAYLGVFAYFVTFFLIGAWHGQTPKFLFFGLLTGLGISVNKLYEIVMLRKLGRTRYRDLCENATHAALSRGLNFLWFSFTMLWFWSNWPQLGHFVSLLGPLAIALAFAAVLLTAALVLSGMAILGEGMPALTSRAFPGLSGYLRTAWYTALVVLTISLTLVLNAPAPHLVYKAF
jgi:D-alanyl-lipoteichoic acid acyltransferase DltB (MBOAT superfamily)